MDPIVEAKVNELRDREYWTPAEAATILGRGADFWRGAFDRGHVEGYKDSPESQRRYLYAPSCRDYLIARSARRVVPPSSGEDRQIHRRWLAVMKARRNMHIVERATATE